MGPLRVISYGGGVQSTAMVVMAAVRDPAFEAAVGGPIDAALFANVGDDSEHPAALAWVREVVQPWAAAKGLPVHILERTKRDGSVETLWGRITREGSRSVTIPARGANGAPIRRQCTSDFKVQVVAKWLKAHGASDDDPATVCIGISTDEIQRAKGTTREALQRLVYPLIDLGFNRQDCQVLNRVTFDMDAPTSSCFFCPFHRPQVWAEMARDEPELFTRSVELETHINDRQASLGRDPYYLTRFGKPLDEAIQPAQDTLPGFESIGETGCDEGYCFT